ncbi:MAG: hypothetical protein WAK17_29990 [Candidatus Nitrosopolaris sp.]
MQEKNDHGLSIGKEKALLIDAAKQFLSRVESKIDRTSSRSSTCSLMTTSRRFLKLKSYHLASISWFNSVLVSFVGSVTMPDCHSTP